MVLLMLASIGGNAFGTDWVVTDTGDAGDGTCDATCTLREAVDSAGNGDRILFDPALPPPVVVTLTGDALAIDTTLRISANKGMTTVLTRTGAGRLMELGGSADVRVEGLAFQDSHMDMTSNGLAEGGAILAASSTRLELRDAVFRNNRIQGSNSGLPLAGPDVRGGAIASAGQLVMDRCAFVGNRTIGAPGGAADSFVWPGSRVFGAAIYSSGSVSVRNCSFSDNAITGGYPGGSAFGGAIYLSTGAVADISFSTLIDNHATPGATLPPNPPGSAVGHAIGNDGTLILDSSVIAANVGSSGVACTGAGTSTRNGNYTDDGSCPGVVIANLDTQFQAIDANATNPHYFPLGSSAVVDALPDCLDALGATLVDVDQLQAPRPGLLAPLPTCDMGAVEYTGAIFADGLETPPAP